MTCVTLRSGSACPSPATRPGFAPSIREPSADRSTCRVAGAMPSATERCRCQCSARTPPSDRFGGASGTSPCLRTTRGARARGCPRSRLDSDRTADDAADRDLGPFDVGRPASTPRAVTRLPASRAPPTSPDGPVTGPRRTRVPTRRTGCVVDASRFLSAFRDRHAEADRPARLGGRLRQVCPSPCSARARRGGRRGSSRCRPSAATGPATSCGATAGPYSVMPSRSSTATSSARSA